MIINGDFENNKCPFPFSTCIWDKSSFKPEWLPGWTFDVEIEIGRGPGYNAVFNSWIV